MVYFTASVKTGLFYTIYWCTLTSNLLFLPEIALPSCKYRTQRLRIFYFYLFPHLHVKKKNHYMHSRSPGFSFSYSIFHLWFLLQVVASQSSSSHLSILTNTDRKNTNASLNNFNLSGIIAWLRPWLYWSITASVE